MNRKHKENLLRNAIYSCMNTPNKWIETMKSKIQQNLCVDDSVLKSERGERNVLIIQNAEINMKDQIVEHGLRALTHLDEYVAMIEDGDFDYPIQKQLGSGRNLYDILQEIEFRFFMKALEKTNGNKAMAAKWLGVQRTTLVEYFKSKRKKKFDALPEPTETGTDLEVVN